MELLAKALNGAKLPNWFWIGVILLGLGFQAGITYMSAKNTKESLQVQALVIEKKDAERTAQLKTDIQRDINDLDSKLDRRTKRINEELSYIGRVTRYVARQVD